jgi:RimJ/RimL family protein N-acetyltransferase
MASSPPPLGPILPNTTPALLPGPSPLIGAHVTLERLSTTHTTDLYNAVGSNVNLWLQVPSGPFNSLPEFSTYIQTSIASPRHAFYAIIPLSTGRAAGHLALWNSDPIHRLTEIGPIMYGPDLARSRAGTEVLYLLGKLVFEELGYRRWEWRFNSVNEASRKAAERYGFRWEGTLRQHMIVRGRDRATCIYAMLDSEWAGVKRVFEGWLADGNFDEEGRQRRTLGEVKEAVGEGGEG